jgi:hypothetical protein
MMDSSSRTVSLSSRMTQPSHFLNSTDSMRLYIVRGEDVSNVVVNVIPAQDKVTLQILSMWTPW